jgi:hypothetical protein
LIIDCGVSPDASATASASALVALSKKIINRVFLYLLKIIQNYSKSIINLPELSV